MKCAGCVQSVERQLLRKDGVVAAAVNLVTQNARIEFSPTVVHPSDLATTLTESGFSSQVLHLDQALPVEVDATQESNLQQLLLAIALVLFSAVGHLGDFLPLEIPVIGTMVFHGALATLALLGPGRSMIVDYF